MQYFHNLPPLRSCLLPTPSNKPANVNEAVCTVKPPLSGLTTNGHLLLPGSYQCTIKLTLGACRLGCTIVKMVLCAEYFFGAKVCGFPVLFCVHNSTQNPYHRLSPINSTLCITNCNSIIYTLQYSKCKLSRSGTARCGASGPLWG